MLNALEEGKLKSQRFKFPSQKPRKKNQISLKKECNKKAKGRASIKIL